VAGRYADGLRSALALGEMDGLGGKGLRVAVGGKHGVTFIYEDEFMFMS